jgi:hypothetical protein
MEDFLLLTILVVLFIRWVILSNRFSELKLRMDNIVEDRQRRVEIDRLVERVHAIESEVAELRRSGTSPKPPLTEAFAAAAISVVKVPPAPVVPPPLPVAPPPIPEPAVLHEEIIVESPSVPPPAFSIPEPAGPTFGQRMREKMSSEEWEAIVGGSWLNKLGVFVLVVGIALFLGYSFTQVGPAGVSAIALTISLAMLAGGVAVERRARYVIFASGLLGGGWAALYFTTYAMQALDAAKVIHSEVLGGILLFAVAAGMIVHSLRYRSQTVTGLAYFVAFVTLAITQVTTLSVITLVPLAASLLFVAQRFAWSEMALFGLVATYGTCASRGDSGAPLWSAQTVFSVYWVLFEVFDLLRTVRRSATLPERMILPLNALGFAGLTYAKWSAAAPLHLYAIAAAVAAAYLASTVVRVYLRPPSSFAPEIGTLDRIFGGGYEGPVTLAAGLSAVAVLLKFHGGPANIGLLAEAELLFLAGLFFREAYPRQLATVLFTVALGKLKIFDFPGQPSGEFAGWTFSTWTPSAALAGALFYINRALRAHDKAYGYAASGVFALIIGYAAPERYLAVSWLVFATVLFELGWLRRLFEFRMQGYLVATLGVAAIAYHQANVAAGLVAAWPHPWLSLACTAAVTYGATLVALRSAANRFGDTERAWLQGTASWLTSAALATLMWRMLPGQYLGLGWLALAVPILELGVRGLPSGFRMQSYLLAGMGAAYVMATNVWPVQNNGPLAERLIAAGAALAAYAIAARLFVARAIVPEREARSGLDVSSATGTVFLLTALWALLPSAVVGPAWAAAALLLMETGFLADIPSVRVQGHLAGACAFTRLFFANFDEAGNTAGISHRLLTVVPVMVAHYYEWSRQSALAARVRDWEQPLRRLYLYSAAVLGVVLLRFELGRSQVVIGWALFGLALLVLGQRWNNVDLRWQSYCVAALAFWRSWTTDFFSPGDLSGAGGRIAAGTLVIASFFAAQLVIPQVQREWKGLERYARPYFSLLSSILTAILLFHEVSGSMLTVAWGIEGVGLLTAGFPLRDRTLRLSGLALFLVCILKLFFYDLRQLETLYRILSFIVLGLILVSVSWVYTRFRDRVHRYL